MEGWKDGRMEEWKSGRVEEWKVDAVIDLEGCGPSQPWNPVKTQ
jgi:hypothetical protein